MKGDSEYEIMMLYNPKHDFAIISHQAWTPLQVSRHIYGRFMLLRS
jgi:hypothetical protein